MLSSYKKKRLKFIGVIFAVSLLALIFIISNFRNNIVFFYSPSELKNEKIMQKAQSRQVRVGGLVKEGSVKKIDALNSEFVITDLKEELKINYRGLLPDLFREQQGVVANGKFDVEKNEFFSSELLIKHDENYMPPEVARALVK